MEMTMLMREARNIPAWSVWLLAYAAFTIVQALTVDWFYGIDTHFFNGGMLLAALLDLTRRDIGNRLLTVFVALIFGLDVSVRSAVGGMEFLPALFTALTLVLQGCLGLWLLQQVGLVAVLPDTQRKVLLFAWRGALLPTLVSSSLLVLATGILRPGSDFAFLGEEFIWWFLSRFASAILVAPALVFGLYHYTLCRQSGTPFLGRDFWGLALGALVCAFIVFSVANPSGRALATYSYLLLPVMLVPAIRLPLFQSLLILLLVSLVCFWADAGGQAPEQARRSFMALSVFLVINGGIIWILGALLKERDGSFRKEKEQRTLYEMLSRVNQTIVKYDLGRESLFEQVCQIILEESDFQRACVVPQPASNVPVSSDIAHCDLIDAVVRSGRSVSLSSCEECPESARCELQPIQRESMAAFPIYQRGTMTAVLAVFGDRNDSFDDDLLRLFQEMADDIGFAIDTYEQREQLNQVAEVFQHSRESIIIADSQGTILNVNPSFTLITGYSRDEAIGNNPRVLKSGRQEKDFYEKLFEQLQSDGYWSGQFWNKRKSGELYLQRGTISAVFDKRGQPRHYIAVMEDVSAHYEAEERINSLANFDQLTGLPNRALLLDRFNLAQSDSRRNGRNWSLMFIDLDDFKQVNDALGHRTGDQLLKGVGQRFKSLVRDTDTLCRFGGDEFIVLMSGGANEAGELARRLINEVNRIYELDGASLQVGASIGISVLFQDGDSLDELIQAADTAMYHAKAQGRGCFQFFEKNMHSRVQNRLALKHALKKAITENEFCLFYQPKVSCTPSGQHETIGFEALVRWNHPETGMVSPEDFIPAAEESGQIADIDRWVLQNAIDQLRIWLQHQPGDVVPVAINVSASLFSKDGFVDELRSLLASSGVPAHLVELEITEHVATHDMERTLETLNQLKKVGVWLAIDDFGTGYSSLSYLQRFPIDRLKIDMSFVRDVHLDHKKQGLVRAILTMAKALDLKTIAEGIEVAEELAFMSQNGCDEYQGYYFGKPVPVAEVSLPRLSPSPA